jgi:hypothetical protein
LSKCQRKEPKHQFSGARGDENGRSLWIRPKKNTMHLGAHTFTLDSTSFLKKLYGKCVRKPEFMVKMRDKERVV